MNFPTPHQRPADPLRFQTTEGHWIMLDRAKVTLKLWTLRERGQPMRYWAETNGGKVPITSETYGELREAIK